MKNSYNVKGEKRKEMVKIIEAVTGQKAIYQGMPSLAYKIGEYTVDKNGTLEYPNGTEAKGVLEAISKAGYKEPIAFTVVLPKDEVNTGNLEKMLIAKGRLIKQSLGLEKLPLKVEEDTVVFPWYEKVPEPETVKAVTRLIAALCKKSKELKTASNVEKETPNPKYAFRCFLLRLGFIGAEFKEDRKVLLQNLDGNSAFKGGTAKCESQAEN